MVKGKIEALLDVLRRCNGFKQEATEVTEEGADRNTNFR